MIIGVPKEIKQQEHRVGLVPSTATTLTRSGHTVLVQKSAGVGSGYPDEDYIAAGAKIIETPKKCFAQAEMIVKVKEPLQARIRPAAQRADSFHLPAPRGEQAADRSACSSRA